MVLVVFRNRLRGGDPPGYEAVASRMVELARQQPGFRAVKTFAPSGRHDAIAIVAGVGVALLVMTFHRPLFGVAVVPFGV